MIGKKWEEVKDKLINHIYVDKDNIDKKTRECIVDFVNCDFLSVSGTYRVENDEVIITIADDAIVYNNGARG